MNFQKFRQTKWYKYAKYIAYIGLAINIVTFFLLLSLGFFEGIKGFLGIFIMLCVGGCFTLLILGCYMSAYIQKSLNKAKEGYTPKEYVQIQRHFKFFGIFLLLLLLYIVVEFIRSLGR